MNIKTGIDIVEVERIQENIEKFGNRFLKRIYTEAEIEYCESKNLQKFQSYAGRFSAKEAVFKAISCWIEDKYEIKWKDIEILNDENGRPYVKCNGSLRKLQENGLEIDISISHIQETAVASAVGKLEKGTVPFSN